MNVSSEVDERRFPTLAAYVAHLPRGLRSYETCQMKASVYRGAIADKPFPLDASDALPDLLRDLVMSPRLVSTWVSTACVQGLFLAVSDVHRMTDATFRVWSYALQRDLFQSALYRGLMVLSSPTLLLTGTRLRWKSIHRGTQIEVVSNGQTATVILLSPPNLFAHRNLLGFGEGFRAVSDLSNAKNVRVELGATKPGRADFHVTWT